MADERSKRVEKTETLEDLLRGLKGEIVISDENINIIYMNDAAIQNHEERGGVDLLGKSLLDCHNADSQRKIREMYEAFADGDLRTRQIRVVRGDIARRSIMMPIMRDGRVKGCVELIVEEPL
jgi:transcriptional regulator with PAS, ATPase and Fis domain